MRKYEFIYETNDGRQREVYELPDEATQKDLDDAFVEWAWQFIADSVHYEEIQE